MSDYDNMNPEEKKASLDGLSMHLTNLMNNPSNNLQFPESNLPLQIEMKMKELFGLKSFTDEASLTEWGIDLDTYLKESCSPGNFADALRFGIEVGKIINSDYQKNGCMNLEHDPKLKNWTLRLPVAIDKLNQNQIESPKKVLPPVNLSEKRIQFDDLLSDIKDKCFNDKDYKQMAGLFIDHFEGRSVILPDTIIPMKNRTMTIFAQRMGEVHAKMAKPNTRMIRNTEFLSIFKWLSQFEGDTDTQIYNKLKR